VHRLRIMNANRSFAMCGCSTHEAQSGTTAELDPNVLTLKVEDMTCGHCAATITKAVEAGLPSARVQADPATKLVSIQGTQDMAKVEALIAGAGYTPSVPALQEGSWPLPAPTA
jgi:copper chaperone